MNFNYPQALTNATPTAPFPVIQGGPIPSVEPIPSRPHFPPGIAPDINHVLYQQAIDAMEAKGTLSADDMKRPVLPELVTFLEDTMACHVDCVIRIAVENHGRSWKQVKKRCKKKNTLQPTPYDSKVSGRSMEDVIYLVGPTFVLLEFGVRRVIPVDRADFFNTHLPKVLRCLDVPEATIRVWLNALAKPRSGPSGAAENGMERAASLYGHLMLYLSGACANCAHEDGVQHQSTCFDHVEARVNERLPKNAGNK